MTRTNRLTGTRITLDLTESFNLDSAQGKWATICEDHGEVLMYDTRAVAESYMAHPDEWCSECAALNNR